MRQVPDSAGHGTQATLDSPVIGKGFLGMRRNFIAMARRLASMRIMLVILALFASGCTLMPTSTDTPELPIPEIAYTRHVLDNGLTLIVHEDPKTPIVAVNVWYHVGSKDERPGRTGFAHLFEHLMFMGTEHYDDDLFRALTEVGGTTMNGTTDIDRTNYFQNVPTPALDRVLWLESDRMGHLLGAVTQEKLDAEREVVKNEKRQYRNQPYGAVWDTIVGATYPEGHPYSWPTIGRMEDLEAATLDDVHNWFRDWYGAANAVIVIAGDVDTDDVIARVERHFGAIDSGPPITRRNQWIARMQGEKRETMQDNVPQARVHMVWNVPPDFHDDTTLLSLAARALSQGRASPLYQRLVYRDQLATDVSAGLWEKELGSQFIIQASARPGVELREVEAAIREELAVFLDQGPDADTLARARTGLYAGLVRGLERVGGFGGKSDLLARSEVIGGSPDAWQRQAEVYRKATPDTVRSAAREWLSDGVYVLNVEPFPEYRSSSEDVDRSIMPTPTEDMPALRLPPLQRATLSNGLQVLIAPRHDAPVISARLQLNAGYAADPVERPGLASLTMGMLSEGTRNRDATQLAIDGEAIGTSVSASAGLDTVTVSMGTVHPFLDPALELFADVVLNPTFPDDELERRKIQRLAAIDQEKARPNSLAFRILPRLLYGDEHPYSQPFSGTGTPESVTAMTAQELRDFHRRWFRPDNATLLVVGDVDADTLVPALESHFGGWAAPEEALALPEIAAVEPASAGRVYLIHRPGPQSMVLAAGLAPPYNDPQDIPMQVVNTALGGMFTSRLNRNLRIEKGWSYGAGSALWDARGQRPFVAYGSVQADRTADSAAEIDRELRELIANRPISDIEVDEAARRLTLTLPGNNETTGEVAGTLSRMLRFGLPDDYFERFVPDVNAVRAEDLPQAAARLVAPERMTWVIVGDLRQIEDSVRALDLGEITVLDGDGHPVR
jgi:zinc protease